MLIVAEVAPALLRALRRRRGQYHRRQTRSHRAYDALSAALRRPSLARLPVRFDVLLLRSAGGPIEWIQAALAA